MADGSSFSERICEQLEAAAAQRREQQNRMGQQMSELMLREADFTKTAAQLMSDIVRPRMEELADYFENATVSTSDSARRCHIRFDHCDRFPATVDVRTTLLSDEQMQSLIIAFDVQILPVFIKFEQHNQLALSLKPAIDENRTAAWLENRLVRFVSDYLTIEHTEQYHHHDFVIDPVCGMKILRKDALQDRHNGQTFYFCAAVCHDKFLDAPGNYLQES